MVGERSREVIVRYSGLVCCVITEISYLFKVFSDRSVSAAALDLNYNKVPQ